MELGANEPETRRESPNCSRQNLEAPSGRKVLILLELFKGKSCCSSIASADAASLTSLQPPLRTSRVPPALTYDLSAPSMCWDHRPCPGSAPTRGHRVGPGTRGPRCVLPVPSAHPCHRAVPRQSWVCTLHSKGATVGHGPSMWEEVGVEASHVACGHPPGRLG